MQLSAEALSRTGFPQRADSQETVRKMAAMKIEWVVSLHCLFFCAVCAVLIALIVFLI